MLKVLHTADWHIGQTFCEFDRTYEHQQFLNWLVVTLTEKEIDVLLMSGDVFDGSNPASSSVDLFYKFLAIVTKTLPDLQIIITAGNHDSAARLVAPNPFFELINIRIIGNVQRLPDGTFDYEKLVIPIKNKEGDIKAWCMAVPFLRPGDYPLIQGTDSLYGSGVIALYKEVYEYTVTKKQAGQAIIAMGHLHTLGTEKTGNDKNERLIMGGCEYVPVAAFDPNIAYTALGHIHRAQSIGGYESIRYSGSALPMSFSEIHYKHQVVLFELEGEQAINIRNLEIPVTIKLLRVPNEPKKLSEVLDELNLLPNAGPNMEHAPYLQVRVLLDGPEPSLRHKIETALINKHVRFAKIDANYPPGNNVNQEVLTLDKLQELQPIDIFKKIYQSRYDSDPSDELIQLFNQVNQEVTLNEN